jgi:hypothetical protein
MTTEAKKRTSIINVGVLDIRNADREKLGVVNLVNVGYIVYDKETGGMLKANQQINVGQYVEASTEATVLAEPVTLTNRYLQNLESPLDLVVFGPLTIEADVVPEAIEKGIKHLRVYGGPFICSQALMPTLQPRIKHLAAPSITFESEAVRLMMGKLELDDQTLHTYTDDSELVVVGPLRLLQVVDNDLLERKLKRIHVLGSVLCHEENHGSLSKRLRAPSQRIKVIPSGFDLVERPLEITNSSLMNQTNQKIYCTQWVRIDDSVTPEALEAGLAALHADEVVYCPLILKDVITKKMDWQKTRIQFYTGKLWFIDDDRELPAYAFDQLEGAATLVVLGQLTVDPDIEPATLLEKLDKVHNLGRIVCTPDQMEAFHGLLGLNEGELVDSTAPKELKFRPTAEFDTDSYVNTNYVAIY